MTKNKSTDPAPVDQTGINAQDPQDPQDPQAINIIKIMADHYIQSLKEIISAFDEWKERIPNDFSQQMDRADWENLFACRFNPVLDRFSSFALMRYGQNLDEQRLNFTLKFKQWLEEWRSFLCKHRLSDSEPLHNDGSAFLKMGDDFSLVLEEDAEERIIDRFSNLIKTEKGRRLAEIQEHLRKGFQDLFDLFEKEDCSFASALRISPMVSLRMFVFEGSDTDAHVRVLSRSDYDHDNRFIL